MRVYHKKTFALGLVISLIAILAVAGTMEVFEIQDPEDVYTSYVYAERDGYAKIGFVYSTSYTSKGKTCMINQDNIGIDVELDFYRPPTNGYYYQYYVVYNNGSILESEKQFMPYGEDRVIMEFVEIYLSIKQNVTGVEESAEQREKEAWVTIIMLPGCIFLVLFGFLGVMTGLDENAYSPYRRRGG